MINICQNKKIIILYGPTAVGKTDISFLINDLTPIEIINGDIGQFYEPLTIGTAKPDWKNCSIPHHLFDYCQTPRDITVVEYRTILLQKLEEIWSRNATPVIVGGSGFYIKSLFFPPKDQTINQDQIKNSEVLQKLLQHQQELSSQELWEILHTYDSLRADQIKSQDRYRIERALHVLQSGARPSEQAPEYVPLPADALLIMLTRDKQELYERINMRTEIMLKDGWIEEVQQLLSLENENTSWVQFLLRKKIIGYDDIIRYLCKDPAISMSHQMLIETIQQKTRRYAKRQLTFLRMLEKLMQSHFALPSRVCTIAQNHIECVVDEVSKFLKNCK